MIHGRKLNLGGTDYVVPPFPMRILREHPEWLKAIRQIEDIPDSEQAEAIVGIVHAALNRNYPDLTFDQVENMLDIPTGLTALTAVMDVSGMAPVLPGSSGEAEPGS